MQEKQYCVYLFIFPNKKYYCGYSGNIIKRWSSKGARYAKCPLVYKAIKKYGWENITKKIIFTTTNQDEALRMEKSTIEKLNLLDPERGYNLVEGGGALPHGSQYITEEGRKKMHDNGVRLANEVWNNSEKKAYTIQRMKEEDHKKRMQMSEEERKEKYGKHNLGRAPYNAKPIYQLDKNTQDIIAEYPTGKSAAKALGNPNYASNIYSCAEGRKNSAYGFKWRWKNENISS